MIFYRRRAERFAQLLDEANGGPRRHARARPDEQLTELVAVGQQLSAARPAVELDGDFRVGLRAMLVATAEREGIGITDPAGEPAPERAVGPVSHARTAGTTARRLRARGAVVLGVAVGAMAVSGISTASDDAMPGDALYGVKRSTEKAQLALASSDFHRGQLFLDFARNRPAEAATVPGSDPGLAGVFTDMDADTRQGVRLLATSAVHRNDEAALTAIDTFVTRQRRQVSVVLPGLGGVNRDRALQSMVLLDDVDRRARTLRAGLACGSGDRDGSTTDALGPQPRTCWSAPGPGSVDGVPPRQSTTQPGATGQQPGVTGQPGATGQPGVAGQPGANPLPARGAVPTAPARPGAQHSVDPQHTATPAPTDVSAPTAGPAGDRPTTVGDPAGTPAKKLHPKHPKKEKDGAFGKIGRTLDGILN
jgi:hypothetical protein